MSHLPLLVQRDGTEVEGRRARRGSPPICNAIEVERRTDLATQFLDELEVARAVVQRRTLGVAECDTRDVGRPRERNALSRGEGAAIGEIARDPQRAKCSYLRRPQRSDDDRHPFLVVQASVPDCRGKRSPPSPYPRHLRQRSSKSAHRLGSNRSRCPIRAKDCAGKGQGFRLQLEQVEGRREIEQRTVNRIRTPGSSTTPTPSAGVARRAASRSAPQEGSLRHRFLAVGRVGGRANLSRPMLVAVPCEDIRKRKRAGRSPARSAALKPATRR